MSIREYRNPKLAEAAEAIKDQVAEFLQRGGEITTCATGAEAAKDFKLTKNRVWWQGAKDDSSTTDLGDGYDMDSSEDQNPDDDGVVFIA